MKLYGKDRLVGRSFTRRWLTAMLAYPQRKQCTRLFSTPACTLFRVSATKEKIRQDLCILLVCRRTVSLLVSCFDVRGNCTDQVGRGWTSYMCLWVFMYVGEGEEDE